MRTKTSQSLFDQWSEVQQRRGLSKPKSLQVYISMWNRISKTAANMDLDISKANLVDLIELVNQSTQDSTSSYPKRMAQLLARVLLSADDKNSAAAKLPDQFQDNRRKKPLILNATAVITTLTDDVALTPKRVSSTLGAKRALRQTEIRKWKVTRAKAMAACALYAGLKANEILNLELNSIIPDNDGCDFNIQGARRRRIPMSSQGHRYIMEWMDARSKIFDKLNQEEKAQFTTKFFIGSSSGGPISRATVHREIQRVLEATFSEDETGQEQSFTATASRNAFAIKQAMNGIPKHIITDWLGYKHSATIYDRISAFEENGGDAVPAKDNSAPTNQYALFKLRPV
ncbi:tyrosine-type recombinase/integrase [Methylobacillus sp. Pita2]|uniref:tyrosine-type recombinase/integrase n=1 Tax=Methylobacillus sp. Pita2 TaxID=3383245 RepID=UPI0038B56379